MKKILLLMTVFLATMAMASAYGGYGPYGRMNVDSYSQFLDRMPYKNPYYDQYMDMNDYKNDAKYRNFRERTAYQRAQSPYILVRSPYGKKPWNKRYGDMPYRQSVKADYNPFYGFSDYKTEHCHGPSACHTHNIDPGSETHQALMPSY